LSAPPDHLAAIGGGVLRGIDRRRGWERERRGDAEKREGMVRGGVASYLFNFCYA